MSRFKILDFKCSDCNHIFDQVSKKDADSLAKDLNCPECGKDNIKPINVFQSGKGPLGRCQWEYVASNNFNKKYHTRHAMTEAVKRQGLEFA